MTQSELLNQNVKKKCNFLLKYKYILIERKLIRVILKGSITQKNFAATVIINLVAPKNPGNANTINFMLLDFVKIVISISTIK